MNVPRLEIFLNESSMLCIAKVEQVGADSRLMVDVDLNELKSHGLEGASSRIGGLIINILSKWHKTEFESWDMSVAEESPELSDNGIAQCLIGKSVLNKTAVHVPSIDLLLSQEAGKNEEARRFFEESWPVIRERLESYNS